MIKKIFITLIAIIGLTAINANAITAVPWKPIPFGSLGSYSPVSPYIAGSGIVVSGAKLGSKPCAAGADTVHALSDGSNWNCYDMVDPTTTRGDFIVRGASGLSRLAIGSNATIVISNGTDPSWQTISGDCTITNVGVLTCSGVNGVTFPSSGTSGGIPYYSSASAISSSALLTNHAVIIGGGAGASPKTIAACNSNTAVMGATGSDPTCRAIDVSSADITGIMGAGNGGTGNGFTAFTGPASSTKTFTLPNSSQTIATDNLGIDQLSAAGANYAMGSHKLTGLAAATTSGDALSKGSSVCGDLAGSAASCSTDTTNASNISSGTLPTGRFPGMPYDITFDFGPGVMTDNEIIAVYVPRAATIAANLSGSGCDSTTAANSSTVVTIKQKSTGSGTQTTVATLTVAGSAFVCSLSTQSAISLAAGDTLIFIGPASHDANLAGFRGAIKTTTVAF